MGFGILSTDGNSELRFLPTASFSTFGLDLGLVHASRWVVSFRCFKAVPTNTKVLLTPDSCLLACLRLRKQQPPPQKKRKEKKKQGQTRKRKNMPIILMRRRRCAWARREGQHQLKVLVRNFRIYLLAESLVLVGKFMGSSCLLVFLRHPPPPLPPAKKKNETPPSSPPPKKKPPETRFRSFFFLRHGEAKEKKQKDIKDAGLGMMKSVKAWIGSVWKFGWDGR